MGNFLNIVISVFLFFQTSVALESDAFADEMPAVLQTDTVSDVVGTITITNSETFYGTQHYLPLEGPRQPIPIDKAQGRDWMLWVLLFALLVLAFSCFNFHSKCKQNLLAIFGLRFFFQIDKDGGFFGETHNYLLYLSFLVSLSLLIYQTLIHTDLLHPWQELNQEYVYGAIFLLVLLFYVLKILFVRFLAWVFNTKQAAVLYLENIFVFNQFVGMILLPLLFHNAFNPTPEALYVMWALVIIANIYKVIRGSLIGHNQSGFSVYYLFLYLCGVELMPLLVIYKVVTSYILAH